MMAGFAARIAASPRWSVTAVVAFALATAATVALLTLKTAATVLSTSGDDQTPTAIVFGSLLLLGIVPNILTIVVGHVALFQIGSSGARGRAVAGVAIGVGYFHLLLWVIRVIAAGMVFATTGDPAQFVPDVFWWS